MPNNLLVCFNELFKLWIALEHGCYSALGTPGTRMLSDMDVVTV